MLMIIQLNGFTQLTNQNIDNSNKEMIMDYFIKKLEEEIKSEK